MRIGRFIVNNTNNECHVTTNIWSLKKKFYAKLYRIHDQLNTLQTAELESLKEFLTNTEDRISRMGSVELTNIEEQVKWESELQADIVRMQERVMDFSNLVVVVESGGEKVHGEGTDVTSMEDQLQALSERWTHVCNWTEKRGELLQNIVKILPEYNKKISEIGDWLESVERELREVECNPDDAEGSSVLGRYEKLKVIRWFLIFWHIKWHDSSIQIVVPSFHAYLSAFHTIIFLLKNFSKNFKK